MGIKFYDQSNLSAYKTPFSLKIPSQEWGASNNSK
jgi:hypothetical protein